MNPPIPGRGFGAAPSPRRRFVPPAAVRLAQVALVLRIGAVLGLLVAGRLAATQAVEVAPTVDVPLPGGMTWTALAPWMVAGSVLEAALVLRLSTLGALSRRVILAVEGLVIAISGLYAAAGTRADLVVLVTAIAAVVLLRMDHVQHSFAQAAAARRLESQRIRPPLYDGYRMPDPTASKPRQLVGYRAPAGSADGATSERSRT